MNNKTVTWPISEIFSAKGEEMHSPEKGKKENYLMSKEWGFKDTQASKTTLVKT